MTPKPQSRTTESDRPTRRGFLKSQAKAAGALAVGPLLGSTFATPADRDRRTLLKNGLIVDGTGTKAFAGDLLIKGAKIEAVSRTLIKAECETIDCAGKVIAPGFIDVHSHMDWVLPLEGYPEFKSPFTAQGCTTFVAGNCGNAVAGFRKDSEHKQHFNPGLFPDYKLTWNTMSEYFAHLRRVGMTHNMVMLAGHGLARASMRWMDPSPLSDTEMRELLALLGEAMDQGAAGVSLGLQYSPGIFAPSEEIRQVARLVKQRNKILTVHARAYSALSGMHEPRPFGTPHNVLALKEMIDLSRETGVRVQYSHLIFAGKTSHKTYAQCLEMIDKAITDGIDIRFDSYPYHCGNTGLTVLLPKWFRENLPGNYTNPAALKKLELQLASMAALIGFSYDDVQIAYVGHPDLNRYNGMFLGEIARTRGQKPFDVLIELLKNGGDRGAWVLLHNYSNMEIIEALMKHPAGSFMTDAVPLKWLRNPAAFGSFPLFLQYARDRKLMSLEDCVRKMTGASADRLEIKDRGYLRKGLAADVTVFDYERIKDNTTLKNFDRPPTGIEAVFINGRHVKKNGRVDDTAKPGVLLAS